MFNFSFAFGNRATDPVPGPKINEKKIFTPEEVRFVTATIQWLRHSENKIQGMIAFDDAFKTYLPAETLFDQVSSAVFSSVSSLISSHSFLKNYSVENQFRQIIMELRTTNTESQLLEAACRVLALGGPDAAKIHHDVVAGLLKQFFWDFYVHAQSVQQATDPVLADYFQKKSLMMHSDLEIKNLVACFIEKVQPALMECQKQDEEWTMVESVHSFMLESREGDKPVVISKEELKKQEDYLVAVVSPTIDKKVVNDKNCPELSEIFEEHPIDDDEVFLEDAHYEHFSGSKCQSK